MNQRAVARRVLRGGSWAYDAGGARSAFRLIVGLGGRFHYVGFRAARVIT